MAFTAEQFGKAVVASGLMSAEQLRSLWAELSPADRPKDGESFSHLLLKKNWLNRFQVTELLAGSSTPLVFGDYVLLGKIGAGGMGQVFKAHHRRMDRFAAIKLLPASLTKDEAAVKRFEREVKAAAKLSHPNIVQTFDAGVQRGVHYLVMEYVDGRDLSAVVKDHGPLPVEQAVDCIVQAARGLAFAHDKGVIHRDVKPANLLYDNEGVVKILDMGLARIESSGDAADHQLTSTGTVMGTVDYMSPEQATNTRNADARSDIYSLGCSLYHLLAGKALYGGDTVVERILAHMNNDIPSVVAIRPDVPAEIDRILQKMVAKSPVDRYQSASQLVGELEAFCHPGASPRVPMPRDSQRSKSPQTIVEPGGGATTLMQAGLTTEQTVICAGADVETDANGQTVLAASSVQGKRPTATKRTQSDGPPGKLVMPLAATGAAALLTLVLGVWWMVRDRGGNDSARVKVPEDGSGSAQSSTMPKTPSLPMESAPVAPPQGAPTTSRDVATTPPLAIEPFDAEKARQHQQAWASSLQAEVVKLNSLGMRMTLIPPGEFLMGSSDADIALGLRIAEESQVVGPGLKRIQAERPRHLVRITKPFRLAAHEVTIGQFAKFVDQAGYKTLAEVFGGNSPTVLPDQVKPANLKLTWRTPGEIVTDDCPVTQVAWDDAAAFCNWLSSHESLQPCYQREGTSWTLSPQANGYRLPTEAEWEYACRAGTSTQFWFGNDWKTHDRYGWSKTNSGERPHPVGSLPANPFGLFDMHGNVWEWCHDWYGENSYSSSPTDDPPGAAGGVGRVFRGGGWNYPPGGSRSSFRSSNGPSDRIDYRGFRPVAGAVKAHSTSAGAMP